MKDALERVYQEALHSGVFDVHLNGKLVGSFIRAGGVPFKSAMNARLLDGAEMTLDYSRLALKSEEEISQMGNLEYHSAFPGVRGLAAKIFSGNKAALESEFDQQPGTFVSFLDQADTLYYEVDGKRKDMRWSDYAARDHEYGRPYAVIGVDFFRSSCQGSCRSFLDALDVG